MKIGQAKLTADCRDFGYVVDERWATFPFKLKWEEVAGVAVDQQDRVYVFGRGVHAVAVFESDGTFLRSWGEGTFVRPHGISIGRYDESGDDVVYCTDDLDHTVGRFTLDGKLLGRLGTPGHASDTGATSLDYRTIQRSGAVPLPDKCRPLPGRRSVRGRRLWKRPRAQVLA